MVSKEYTHNQITLRVNPINRDNNRMLISMTPTLYIHIFTDPDKKSTIKILNTTVDFYPMGNMVESVYMILIQDNNLNLTAKSITRGSYSRSNGKYTLTEINTNILKLSK